MLWLTMAKVLFIYPGFGKYHAQKLAGELPKMDDIRAALRHPKAVNLDPKRIKEFLGSYNYCRASCGSMVPWSSQIHYVLLSSKENANPGIKGNINTGWWFNPLKNKTLLIKGSLGTKIPTKWTNEKHSQEEAEPGRNSDVEKVRKEKIRDGESQKREDAGAREGRKVAKHCVFSNVLRLRRGPKVGSLKRRVRRHLAR